MPLKRISTSRPRADRSGGGRPPQAGRRGRACPRHCHQVLSSPPRTPACPGPRRPDRLRGPFGLARRACPMSSRCKGLLVLEEPVVHLPILALVASAVGGLGGLARLRMDLSERIVPKHVAHLARVDVVALERRQCRDRKSVV